VQNISNAEIICRQSRAQDREEGLDSHLKETIDLSSLGVYVNIEIAWGGRQTWDGLDVGRQSVTVEC
jgi:hypothetical protein